MNILRVFNNNVVLAHSSDDNREIILIGRGIGFQMKPGDTVKQEKIEKKFVPDEGRDPGILAQTVADIPPESFHIVSRAMEEAGLSDLISNSILLISLADHVSFVLKRSKTKANFEYPLPVEVRTLYPGEYGQAKKLFAAINNHLTGGKKLPVSEITAIVLHLVNIGFSTGDLSYTYAMTGIIRNILAEIGKYCGKPLNIDAENTARFITHLRYMFIRICRKKQLTGTPAQISSSISEAFPEAEKCTERISEIFKDQMKTQLTTDEKAYITLHLSRILA